MNLLFSDHMITSMLIGHVDADCFYVSAERIRRPDLVGKPVGVLGNQRACVIAKSYEAKSRGVKTGMPIWEARACCPDIIAIDRDFHWYEKISREMLSIVKEVSPLVEFYSIDESFFDADYLCRSFRVDELETATAMLQQRMLAETQIPVSIGIAPSKILAKLASDANKPFGCTVARAGSNELEGLLKLPITEVCGLAHRRARKLEQIGIVTCLDFARASRPSVRRVLTVVGEQLWFEIRGESVLPIVEKRPLNKAIARGGSMGGATLDPHRVWGWCIRNLERLIEALDHHRVYCDVLALSLSDKEGRRTFARSILPETTADFFELAEELEILLGRTWQAGQWVSYMHVIAEKLSRRDSYQLGLFSDATEKKDRLSEAKRLVNDRFGRFTLRSGATLCLTDVYSDDATYYDICDVFGKTCF